MPDAENPQQEQHQKKRGQRIPQDVEAEDGERGGAEEQQHLPGGTGGRSRGLAGMSFGTLLQHEIRQIEKGQEHQDNPQAEGKEARTRHPERPDLHPKGKGDRHPSAEEENDPFDQFIPFHKPLINL